MELNAYPYLCVSQTRTLISYVVVFFMFNDLMLEVCFVEIGGIVDHHCIEVIVCFDDVGGIVNHPCIEMIICLLILVELLTITV